MVRINYATCRIGNLYRVCSRRFNLAVIADTYNRRSRYAASRIFSNKSVITALLKISLGTGARAGNIVAVLISPIQVKIAISHTGRIICTVCKVICIGSTCRSDCQICAGA
jgi:hypothetical protein